LPQGWHAKEKVLLIDIDSQSNTSKVLLPNYPNTPHEKTIVATVLERKPLSIHKTNVPNLLLVPSHILLSNTDIELTTAIDHREVHLKTALEPVAKKLTTYSSTASTLSWLTINALTASGRVIVVVSPGYFELDSSSRSARP